MAVLDKPVFEEPQYIKPPSKYERVMEPLMERPNEWAKIGEYGSRSSTYQAASNLRSGRYRLPGNKEDWEFAPNDNLLYARYSPNGTGNSDQSKPKNKDKGKG